MPLIGQNLVLHDLHSFVRCLFLHYDIIQHGDANIRWNETQQILLDGFLPLLHAANRIGWTGWLRARVNTMCGHLHNAALTNRTLVEAERHFAMAMHVANCKHYELMRFAHDALCERCRERNATYAHDLHLCSPCWQGLCDSTYMKILPENADPYSWIGSALVRQLCSLPRSTIVLDFARQHAIRHQPGNGDKHRYLLKDVLPKHVTK